MDRTPLDAGRLLRLAAYAFGATVVVTSAIAVRDEVEGRPLGATVPLSVPMGIAAGWGAGVASPWPMAVAVIAAARRTTRPTPSAWPGRVCAILALAGILGLLVEPNTYRPRRWTRATALAVVLDLLGKCALLLTGVAQVRGVGAVA